MQAEARRRSRINERLDALRRIVPHTERANTAVFLEDVVRYVQTLQQRVFELESKLGIPPSVHLSAPILFGETTTPEGTAGTAMTGPGNMERLAIQAALQQAAIASAVASVGTVAQQLVGGGGMPPQGGLPGFNNTTNQAATTAAAAGPMPVRTPALPSVSEELRMAQDLRNQGGAAGAMMAESMPRQVGESVGMATSQPPPALAGAGAAGVPQAQQQQQEQGAQQVQQPSGNERIGGSVEVVSQGNTAAGTATFGTEVETGQVHSPNLHVFCI